MQSDYVTVHDASLNWQKEKPPDFKGVVDHTLMFGGFLRNVDARYRMIRGLYVFMSLLYA